MIQELLCATLDLYMDQGDTFYKTLTIKDDAGAIIDLSGYTIEASMTRYLGTSRLYNLVPAIITPAAGTISLTMSEMDTRALNNGRYVYTVRLRNSTIAVKIMEGQVIVMNTALSPIAVSTALTGTQAVGTGA